MLEFDEPTHTYRYAGKLIPSVTQVLEPLQQLEGIPVNVLAQARLIGTHVHTANHLMVQKRLDWGSLDPVLLGYVSAAKAFLDDTHFQVLRSECRLYHAKLQIAGTLDIFGIWGRKSCVVDWKTSSQMSRTVGPQTSAYDECLRQNFGGRPNSRYGVQLFEDGTYKVYEYKDSRDWIVFQSALNVYNFLH